MKVKELISKLQGLDQNKEIFLYTDGNYLQEVGTFFKLSYSFNDLELKEGYYLETKDEVLFEEKLNEEEEKDLKESAKIAKKYMKQEGYEKVEKEGICYCFEAF